MARRRQTAVSCVTLQYNSKQALLDALEARRAWAIKLDERQRREHAATEKLVLEDFKKRCRAASKWTYTDLKRAQFEISVPWDERPECPVGHVSMLDRTLAAIRYDGRTRYKLTNGNLSEALYLLTHDENAKRDVCE